MMIANSSYTPYFRYFAEQAFKEGKIEFTYVFLHLEEPKIIKDVEKFGVKSVWLNFDYKKGKKIQYLKLTFKLFKLFRKIKPDIVHTHLFDDSLPGLLAAKWAGVKRRVITKQDTNFHFLFAKKGMKFDRINNMNATEIIAVSQESYDFILNVEKAEKTKLKIIHHGVDEKEFTTASESEKEWVTKNFNPEKRILIGTVARLVESKGYKYIVEAMEMLVKKRKDVCFVAAGGGPQQQMLQEMINEKKLQEHFILAGHIEKKYIPAFYQSLAVYVHASIYEPFGFVIPEAIFNKVPMVTTNTGASRDALEHLVSAYFIRDKNPEDIFEGIEYMINNDTQNIISSALVKANAMFTLEKMWQGYKSVYLNE